LGKGGSPRGEVERYDPWGPRGRGNPLIRKRGNKKGKGGLDDALRITEMRLLPDKDREIGENKTESTQTDNIDTKMIVAKLAETQKNRVTQKGFGWN